MPRKRVDKSMSVQHRKRDDLGKFQREEKLEAKLIENLVELQKVHTHLVERFDKLSTQIENLLALFEMSARQLASQPGMVATERDKEFLDKVDKLLDQNKIIAKGLTIMEDRIRERVYGAPVKPATPAQPTPAPQQAPQQAPPQPQSMPMPQPFPAPKSMQRAPPQQNDDEIIPSPFQNRPSAVF